MNEIAAAPSVGSLMFGLLHAAQAVEGRMEEAFASVGLSTARFGVLGQLVQAGEPLPLSEIAARLSCVRSNMTQLVDRLEADGLVRRVNDPDDRRSIRAELTPAGGPPLVPPMATLHIQGGRKEKIRAGDVLGALTKDLGCTRDQVGKIDVNEFSTYVAVDRSIAADIARRLGAARIKGRGVKVRLLDD